MSDVGFIGLGTMGAPMAGHLLAGGHRLFVQTRSQVPESLTAAGAVVCASGKDVAQKAATIFLMVPDTPDVEKVLFGDNGVAAGLAPPERARRHAVVLPLGVDDTHEVGYIGVAGIRPEAQTGG